jgi:hypothetical protein
VSRMFEMNSTLDQVQGAVWMVGWVSGLVHTKEGGVGGPLGPLGVLCAVIE